MQEQTIRTTSMGWRAIVIGLAFIIAFGVLAGLLVTGGLRELTLTEAERQARAEHAWTQVQAAQAALPAVQLRDTLLYVGLGIGALVLAVGGSFALVVWLNRRASTVYPNDAGLYPIVVKSVFGGVVLHDPNRAAGPTAVYRTPTLFDALTGLVGRAAPPWRTPPAEASFPVPAGADDLAQIVGRAQSVQMMVAATRRPQTPAGPLPDQVPEVVPHTQVIHDSANPMLLAIARQLGDQLPVIIDGQPLD